MGLTNSVYSVREGNGFVKVCVAMGKPNLTVRLRTISGMIITCLECLHLCGFGSLLIRRIKNSLTSSFMLIMKYKLPTFRLLDVDL